MKKTLYLECNSGISGDMTVGALLDLGADRKVLEDALASLGVDGYHLHFGTTEKCGIPHTVRRQYVVGTRSWGRQNF